VAGAFTPTGPYQLNSAGQSNLEGRLTNKGNPREVLSEEVSNADGSGVKSAERALTILELFSGRNMALTFTEVADKLGYPRSSLHGLLRTLAARGWLRLDPATRRFSLGLRAWEAGNAYTPATELSRGAAPVLQWLETSFDGSVVLSVLDGQETVCIACSAGQAGGRSAATASAAGRLLLAGDRDAMSPDGAGPLAMPVRDRSGAVVAALQISGPAEDLSGERRGAALQTLRQGADRISAALGFAG